jgi:hypothetical protein
MHSFHLLQTRRAIGKITLPHCESVRQQFIGVYKGVTNFFSQFRIRSRIRLRS